VPKNLKVKTIFKADDKFSGPLMGMQRRMARYTQIAKIAKRASQKLGRAMAKIGAIAKRVALGLGIVAIASMKLARDFNRSMASIGTLIPGQIDKLNQYKDAVLDMAIETGTKSEILSAGLYQVISAIGDTGDSLKVLKISARAAKAGLADTSDAVLLLTKVSTAYGDTSAEMVQHVSDLSFLAVKLGVTTFPELAASMGKISATSTAMGVSVEELYADTAALTKVMGDTAQAATGMDAVMAGLMLGGGKLDKQFKKLGVSSGRELIEKFGGLQNALLELKGSVGGNADKFMKMFGRKEAQKAAGLLTGNLAEIAKENLKEMNAAAGATDRAFEAQTQQLDKAGFTFDQMIERIKKIAIRIGDQLLPIMDRWMKNIEKFFPEIEKNIPLVAEFVEGLVKFTMKLWKFRYVLLAVAAGVVAFKTALLGMELASTATTLLAMGGNAAKAGKAVGGLSTALGSTGLVAAAGAAGVAVGLFITKILEENAKLADATDNKGGNKAADIGRGASKMGIGQLQKSRAILEREKRNLQKNGNVGTRAWKQALEGIDIAMQQVDTNLKLKTKQYIEKGPVGMFAGDAQGQTQSVPAASPQMSFSSSETSKTERTELVIRDETGRGEITKGGKNGTVKLVPTAAMP